MHGSQYVTNQSMHGSKYMTNHQLEKDVGCKVLQFITRWRLRSHLVTKPYGVQTQQLLEEKDKLGHMSLVHNMLVKNFYIEVHQLWWPLKQSLYMFRVVRKENPNIYTLIGVKSVPKNWFFKPQRITYLSSICRISGLNSLLNLDRY